MQTIEDGTTAYSVVLYGDNGEDPTFRIDPRGTFVDKKEAVKFAKREVRIANANDCNGILWSAEVEEGHREGVSDPEYGYIPNVHWEAHESGFRRWYVQLADGLVVEQ